MKAIILAGGFGTRLQPLTFVRPKHMLPIVDKPMLRHIVDYLIENGVNEIWISIGSHELFEAIEKYFSENKVNANIYFIKEPQRLGGAGAIKYAVEKSKINETFALVLGDNITDINLKEMFGFHKENPAVVTIALAKTETPWRYGVAKLDGIRITEFVEKPPIGKEPSNLISTGVYIMEPKIIEYIPKKFLDSTGMLFPLILQKGGKINGFVSDSFWVDVGRPSSYLEATAYILRKYGKENWIDENVKIGEGTKLVGPVVIYNGTEIGRDCIIKNSVIFEDNKIGNNCHIVNSILDIGCKIGDGVKISTTLGRGSVLNNGNS
ncbi:MAG: NDP-sugar synthase [Nanoarchaeota archaeon]|nr:NDP-sugar synthase [Nanoarchaeota archaeon]